MFNDDYPVLVDALKSLKGQNFTIDREAPHLISTSGLLFSSFNPMGKKTVPAIRYF
jgi:hypothetical protein